MKYVAIFFSLLISLPVLSSEDLSRSLVYKGRTRTCIVHLPNDYKQDAAHALVLVLHGGGGSAEGTPRLTGFNQKSDREGFVVVYPNGAGRLQERLLTWNAGNCCGYALDHGIDDAGFLRELILKLQKEFRIDSKRIYVTGLSNGAMMSYRLACEASDLIAAVAPVAGAMNVRCKPSEPISVIAIHGAADEFVLYTGGKPKRSAGYQDRTDAPAETTVSFWAKHDGCAPTPLRQQKGSVSREEYAGCKNGTSVQYYLIHGEGHTWPGGIKWARWADEPTKEISATDVMWDFFKTHPKE